MERMDKFPLHHRQQQWPSPSGTKSIKLDDKRKSAEIFAHCRKEFICGGGGEKYYIVEGKEL